MKTASAAMISFLHSSQQFLLADLYTLTLVDGTVYRYTSCDIDLTVGGNTYDAGGPIISRGPTSIKVGIEVDSIEIVVVPKPTDELLGVPWLTAAWLGMLDGSTWDVRKLITDDFSNTSRGSIRMFSGGSTAEVEITGSEVTLQVKSPLELLNIMWPKDQFQSPCLNTLYDDRCGVNPLAFDDVSAVESGTTVSRITCNLSQGSTYFDLGKIEWINGPLAGQQYSIREYSPGGVRLMKPMPLVPPNGTLFRAYAGCDKKKSTCVNKFDNLPNFRATPYTPVPETSAAF